MGNKLRLGIFGGSFDPVHCGHLQLAAAAFREFSLDKIIFVPARQPPHKKKHRLAPAKHRLAMLQRALRPFPRFSISLFEIRRASTTYTYQTVRHFRRMYPDAELYFLIGSDSLAELHTWKKIELLSSLCGFIVGKRPGSVFRRAGRIEAKINALKKPIRDVSSSEIRALFSCGRSVKKLVPDEVRDYINRHQLYAERQRPPERRTQAENKRAAR